MKKNKPSHGLVTALDVGTTKICVLVGLVLEDGSVEVLGIGKAQSDGLKKGVVVDVARTVASIRTALKEAELMIGFEIDSVVVGISGAHIQSRNAYGAVPIEKGEVTKQDIAHAIAAARAVPLQEGQQVLHVLPQFFSIDGGDRIQHPLGMHGIRLETQIHMITGAISSVQNLVTCCERAGVRVQDIILEQLASGQAVLNEDERELGVGMVDIGGGTSDVALYQHGSIRHTMVIPIAGNHFTNDLAVGLRTTLKDAERVKKEYGLASVDLLCQEKEVEVEMVQGGRKQMVLLSHITEILEPRAEELLSIIHEEIMARNIDHILVSGLVLTGGGSLLDGMDEVAKKIFGIPVRIGRPHIIHTDPTILKSPLYATGYGLLLHAVKKTTTDDSYDGHNKNFARLLHRMKSWVSDFF
jgi:cell division protein FtsA